MEEDNRLDKAALESNQAANSDQMDAAISVGNQIDVQPLQDAMSELQSECGKLLIGQSDLVELLMTCILCGGHALLEGVPGVAKTLSAKVLSRAIDADFKRIQFTPDLLPTDILGVSIYDMNKGSFHFTKGPIFANIVLIDEINRAPAKTQSALFEVMEEKQITNDGERYDMTLPFIVIATQNPIEQEGTYRLPEAQLDRFLMKINLDYPSLKEEVAILERFKNTPTQRSLTIVEKVLSAKKIKKLQKIVRAIRISDQMLQYIAELIHKTRNHTKLYLGGSPRASLALLNTSKVMAGMSGRDFVVPDDIKNMAGPILNHRIILTPEAEMEELSTQKVIAEILSSVEIPR